jgi:exoribonuclease-2
MLNNDVLQQLSQLKSALRTSKDIAQGSVRTTTKRFGFVKLEDGREAFIDPEQMQRLLPDDRIQVEILTNAKDQLEARLEKLIHSPLRSFVGRYVIKGNGHFVEPDLPLFNRWLFIPPQDRKNCQEGDLIQCEISRHPFHSEGKCQARIVTRLGRSDDPGIESRYVAAKYQLPTDWDQAAIEQAQAINSLALENEHDLEDLTHLPFITIDAENTRDMDDALYISEHETGWELITAIADPTRHIAFDSPLERCARQRAHTVYLLGQSLSMLPVELAHDTYSLVAEKVRPALVCRIHIAIDGTIGDFRFSEAKICSRHKLSYQGVQDFLSGDSAALTVPEEIQSMLLTLARCAGVRGKNRAQHALVMEERPDYYFILNDQKKIERIEKRTRNMAHRLVEEAMLATNICAGNFFEQHPGYGIFSSHIGFRRERLDDAVALIKEDKPDYSIGDLTQLEDFQRLLRTLRLNLDQDSHNFALQAVLQRMLQAGALSTDTQAHFGLGFPTYATITSPIRRYHDLFNHYAIKRILRGDPPQPVEAPLLEQLQEQLTVGRSACRQLELWLCCQYVAQHIGSVHRGTITQVNASGLGVRLEDIGVDGFALLADREAGIKPAFDSRRLTLSLDGQRYHLDQTIYVIVNAVDLTKLRIALEIVNEETAARLQAWTENESPLAFDSAPLDQAPSSE